MTMTGYNLTPICEKLWHDRGYLCMVVLTPMGHRCGYVGIHKGQPYYGDGYHKLEWIECHGGLTYSENYHPAYKDDGDAPIWWIGFDCAHCYDIPDVKAAEDAWGAGSEQAKRAERMASLSFGDYSQVRSIQFCEAECAKIVDQLVNGRTNTMREILFRGKHKATGKWCDGNIHIDKQGVAIITPDNTPLGCYGQVDPETVGQFTGLTDKNGKKIFEGDVVHMNSRKFGLSGHGVVVYRNGGFAINDRKRNRLYPFMQNGQYNAGDYRVEGNIHDNPELLEGGSR